MYFYKKLVILIVILMASYILYRLYNRRLVILKEIADLNKSNVQMEGFTDSIVSALQTENKTELTITNLNTNNMDSKHGYNNPPLALQLKQFCIKSSYKTAYNGSDVSIDMIKYVLERGCRFIDFDLFYDFPSTTLSPNSTSKTAVLSYGVNTDSVTPAESSPTYTKISFGNVCSFISQNAFSSVPNRNDPLFIQLNLNCTDESKKGIFYENVAEAIMENFLTSQLYQGKVDSDTPIDQLYKQVIFIINNQLSPDYQNVKYVKRVKYILANYMNMNNWGDPSVTPNTMITVNYDTMQTNLQTPMQINQNDGNSGNDVINPNFGQVLPIQANSIMTKNMMALSTTYNTENVMPMMYWINDTELIKYETMFTKQKRGIVPIGKLYKYLTWYKKQYASF